MARFRTKKRSGGSPQQSAHQGPGASVTSYLSQSDILVDLSHGDVFGAQQDALRTVLVARFPVAGSILNSLVSGSAQRRRNQDQIAAAIAAIAEDAAQFGRGLDGFGRSIRVEVVGLPELRAAFRGIPGDLNRELSRELKHAVEIASREAAARAPYRTGRLARSYRPYVRGTTAGVRSRLPYAALVEYGGTIRPRAVPIHFPRVEPVTRAVDHTGPMIVADMARTVDSVARKHGFR
jgi:hypothetical protein